MKDLEISCMETRVQNEISQGGYDIFVSFQGMEQKSNQKKQYIAPC